MHRSQSDGRILQRRCIQQIIGFWLKVAVHGYGLSFQEGNATCFFLQFQV
jgi:hypothetical protein